MEHYCPQNPIFGDNYHQKHCIHLEIFVYQAVVKIPASIAILPKKEHYSGVKIDSIKHHLMMQYLGRRQYKGALRRNKKNVLLSALKEREYRPLPEKAMAAGSNACGTKAAAE